MTSDVEERIRARAYEIWESEGKPEHEDVRHWLQASKELRDDRDDAALLQGAGERGDFDASRVRNVQQD